VFLPVAPSDADREIRAMRTETRGTLAILGSSLGYGALAILAKLALGRGVGVVPLLAWRFLIAAAVLWPIVVAGRLGVPGRARAGGVAALGILYAGNALAFMTGLERIPAALASLIFFTYPVVTVLLARVWIGEPLTSRRIVSLAAASLGCALIIGQGVTTLEPLGIAFVLLAVVLIAAFIVRSHATLARVPPLGAIALLMTTTAIALTGIGLARGGLAVPTDPRTLSLLAMLGVLSTAIPVTLFLLGIQWIGPARAAIFSTVEPLVTVALAAMVLGERLSPLQTMGGALILGGVVWLRLERPVSPGASEEPG
jgi:drug/metabolite transporter (DMT)-like permease